MSSTDPYAADTAPAVTLTYTDNTPADDGSQVQTIVSALPVFLTGVDDLDPQSFTITGSQDVTVVADSVFINGQLNLNAKAGAASADESAAHSCSLTIVCRELGWAKGASITASGQAGKAGVNAASAGATGNGHSSSDSAFVNGVIPGPPDGNGNNGNYESTYTMDPYGSQEQGGASVDVHTSRGMNGSDGVLPAADATGHSPADGCAAGNGGAVSITADLLGDSTGLLTITTTGGNGGQGADGTSGGNGGAGGSMYCDNSNPDSRWPDGWGDESPFSSVDWSQMGGPVAVITPSGTSPDASVMPGACAGGAGGNGSPGGASGAPGTGGAVTVNVRSADVSGQLTVNAAAGAAMPGPGGLGGLGGQPGQLTYNYNGDSGVVPQPPVPGTVPNDLAALGGFKTMPGGGEIPAGPSGIEPLSQGGFSFGGYSGGTQWLTPIDPADMSALNPVSGRIELPTVTAGDPTAGWNGPAGPQAPGVAGPVTIAKLTDGDYATAIAGQPYFVNMLLMRARGAYALGNTDPGAPSNVDTVADAQTWLEWLRQLGSSVTDTQDSATVDYLTALASETGGLRTLRTMQNRSYNGNAQNYLAPLSLDGALKKATDALAQYTTIYSEWVQCTRSAATQNIVAAKSALANAQAYYDQTGKDVSDAQQQLVVIGQAVNAAQIAVKVDQDALSSDLTDAIAALNAVNGLNNCSLSDIISASAQLAQLAMMPEESGAGRLAGFAGWSTAAPLLSGAVAKYDTQKLAIEKLDFWTDDASLSTVPAGVEGYKTNPNGYKLIADAQQLETKLQALGDSTDPHVAATLTAINAFVETVQNINAQILQYNALLAVLLGLQAKQDRQSAQFTAVSVGAGAGANPEQLQYVQFVFSMMAHAREQMLDALYDAVSSYNVWSLTDQTLSFFLPAATIDDVTPAVVSAGVQNLNSAVSDVQKKRLQPANQYPSQDQPAVTVTIDDVRTIAALKTADAQGRNVCKFKLHAPMHNTPLSENAFGGLRADIRMSHVHIELVGVSVAAGTPLHTTMSAYGAQWFVSQSNNMVSYLPASGLDPTYIVDCDAVPGQVSTGGAAAPYDSQDGNVYPPPSPFSLWVLEVDASQNTQLDLSNVTAIKLTFSGDFFSFPGAQPGAMKATAPVQLAAVTPASGPVSLLHRLREKLRFLAVARRVQGLRRVFQDFRGRLSGERRLPTARGRRGPGVVLHGVAHGLPGQRRAEAPQLGLRREQPRDGLRRRR